MKSASLKKIGAIALAAVMAVTFAPVASLNAFAATKLNTSGDIAQDDTEIDSAGTYTLKTAAATTGISIPATVSGTVTIELNGFDATVVLTNATAADVVIQNTTSATVPTLVVTDGANAKSLAIKGDLKTGTNNYAAFVSGPSANIKATVAGGTNEYYVGATAIQDASAGKCVIAESGNVSVSDLASGKSATIDKDAVPGTTISATAKSGISLVQVVTKYNFYYKDVASTTFTDAATKTVGYGTNTFTDTAFYAGAAAADLSAQKVPEADDADFLDKTLGGCATGAIVKKASTDKITVTGIISYDRAITLKEDPKDKFGTGNLKAVGYADTDTYNNTTKAGVTGITYFTQDPSAYMNETSGQAALYLIDGNKYVLSDNTNNQTGKAAGMAASSVKVIRGKAWTKADGDKTVSENFTVGANVEVTAPEDTSVVDVTAYDQNGVKTNKTRKVYVEGYTANTLNTKTYADFGGEGTIANFGTADKVLTLKVAQVAKDHELAINSVNPALKAKNALTTGSGIDYYFLKDLKVDGTTTDTGAYGYVFGATDKVADEFATKAAGKKTATGTIGADWTGTQSAFASKGIKCTLENVAAGVILEGETSTAITKVDASTGVKTWVINGGDVNTPVKAYRFVNLKNGEHLYTVVPGEIVSLTTSPDWKLENDNAFTVLPWNTTVEGAVKVVRFRSNKGEFLYSSYDKEQAALDADPNWTREGVAFCGVKDNTTGYPVTRLFSTIGQGHLYATAQAEVKNAVEKYHYVKDGVVFFAVETPEKEK